MTSQPDFVSGAELRLNEASIVTLNTDKNITTGIMLLPFVDGSINQETINVKCVAERRRNI